MFGSKAFMRNKLCVLVENAITVEYINFLCDRILTASPAPSEQGEEGPSLNPIGSENMLANGLFIHHPRCIIAA